MKTECVLYEAAGSCAMYVTIYQKFLATSMKTQPSLNMYIYNQCIRGKNGSTEHSKGNKKQYHEKWLHHLKRMDTNRIQNKHYNISQKDEET